MSVSWGILSTARINQKILAGARYSSRVKIVAVAGRDRARTEAYAKENGIPRAYGSYDELLADPEVQAIYVSLPNSLHTEWSIRALDAGKHVLCEKPLSRRVADVTAAFDAAQRNGLLLMEAFMYLHHPQTAALVDHVTRGAIGELQLVRAVYGYNLLRILGDEGTDLRLDPGLHGGALQDLGCYCVSSARLLGGEPKRVHGAHVLGRTGVDVSFAGTLEFERGLIAQFECAFSVEGRAELEAIGTEGRLLLREPWRIENPGIELWGKDGSERIACEEADSYRLELENLSAAIQGDGQPLVGRADAVGQARVIEALFESAQHGRAVVPAPAAELGAR